MRFTDFWKNPSNDEGWQRHMVSNSALAATISAREWGRNLLLLLRDPVGLRVAGADQAGDVADDALVHVAGVCRRAREGSMRTWDGKKQRWQEAPGMGCPGRERGVEVGNVWETLQGEGSDSPSRHRGG